MNLHGKIFAPLSCIRRISDKPYFSYELKNKNHGKDHSENNNQFMV